ncbi:MAG: hypothetical protein V4614_11110 [Pseudomonadota bacterium]
MQLELFLAQPKPAPPVRMRDGYGINGYDTKLEYLSRPNRRCFRTVTLDGKSPSWSRNFYINNCQDSPRFGRPVAAFNYWCTEQ